MPRNENVSETLKQIRAIDINLHHREFDRKLEQVFTAVGCRANRTMPYDNHFRYVKRPWRLIQMRHNVSE